MPVNTFTPNMPTTVQSLGFTQPLVIGNFGNYKENLEVNHAGVNSADFGKHKFLTMPQQSSVPTVGATEGGLYCQKVAGRSVMFLNRETNAATAVGMSMFPFSATALFTNFQNVIDLSTLVDATHPNFWGFIEVRDVVPFFCAFAFLYTFKDPAGVRVSQVFLTQNLGGTGTVSFQMSGNTVQMKIAGVFAPVTANFTITPLFFPVS